MRYLGAPAECCASPDTGARVPIGASRNFIVGNAIIDFYFHPLSKYRFLNFSNKLNIYLWSYTI